MPPEINVSAANEPIVAVLNKLDELKDALIAANEPKPLWTGQPWKVVGVSKTAWYSFASQFDELRPIRLPGAGPKWRIRDLEKFSEKLKLSPRRVKKDRLTIVGAEERA